MRVLSIKSFLGIFRFFWLTGPLFGKELRVSSRRRRNYFLRSTYIIILTLFITVSWLGIERLQGTSALEKSRMAQIGKGIVVTIVTFQFFAAQIIAIIILSNSISDEIYHRTLGVLMTTPINSLQIIIGKLFSKLLQIILLLAISLPMLAVVRIFGGVSWNYIFSSLCITLTAAIFAGSVSLAFSMKNAHTYVVIIKSFFTIGVLFGFFPLILAVVFGQQWLSIISFNMIITNSKPLLIFIHLNPFGTMSVNSAIMLSPAAAFAVPFFYWPIHCIIMLCASALIIAFSVKVVRKIALQQILGELDFFSKLRQSFAKRKNPDIADEYPGSIREVKGLPVLWKEIRKPIIQGIDRTNSVIGLVITIVTLLITYFICYKANCLDEEITHMSYVFMFVIIGIIFNLVLSISSISSEKESRAWPLLLATSLDDWQIICEKALGVFFRCLPVWLLLAGHVILFIFVGYIHPITFVHLFLIIFGLIVFMTGTGLYMSSSFKRTTWAIITCFSFIIIIWVFFPAFLSFLAAMTGNENIIKMYYSGNPFVQLGVVMNSSGGFRNAGLGLSRLYYNWPLERDFPKGVYETTKLLFFIMLVYILFGLFFTWLAKRRIRQHIF